MGERWSRHIDRSRDCHGCIAFRDKHNCMLKYARTLQGVGYWQHRCQDRSYWKTGYTEERETCKSKCSDMEDGGRRTSYDVNERR